MFLAFIINWPNFKIVLLGSDNGLKKVAFLLNNMLAWWEPTDPSYTLPNATDSIQSNTGYKRYTQIIYFKISITMKH